MSLFICACQCGSSEQLARQFLQKHGYPDWISIPVIKGKERSRNALTALPQYKEVKMLDNYLINASKWVVILGYNENGCRWADLTHGGFPSQVEAGLIVETFGDLQ